MADAESGKRPKRSHTAWTAEDKVWVLDYAAQNPKISAQDLGVALANHVNAKRSDDQIPRGRGR